MKVLEINKAFRKFGEIQVKFRWLFLLAMFVITAVGLSGLRKFVAEDLQEDWFGDKEKIKLATDRFEETFGNEDVITVLVQTKDVFDSDVLNMIDRLGNEMMETIPYARDVMSVVEVSVAKGTDDGMQVVTPFEDGIPDTHTAEGKAEMESIKKFLLSREAIANKLVSEDATETWVILYLYGYGEEDNKARTGMYKAGRAAHKLLEDPKWQSDKWNLICAGTPYTECEESDVMRKEMSRNLISGFIAMIICLILFVRSLRGLIVPLFSTVGGIGVVFGFMSYFGIVADQNMMTIPILLGMALSVGYSIHYINSFKLHFRQTGIRKESVIMSVEETGWPLFFTALTTIASLISFALVDIGPLKWLGLTSSATVLVVFLYAIILIPVLLSFGKDKKKEESATVQKMTKADLAFESFGKRVLKHSKAVLIVGFAMIVVFIPGIFKIRVTLDYIEMLGLKIPYIARLAKLQDTQLGSVYSYKILIEYPDVDEFKKPERMFALEKLENTLGNLSLTRKSNGKPRVKSVLDIVKETNRMLNGDDPAYYSIPDDEDLLTQELFLYEITGGSRLYDWLNADYNMAYVNVNLATYDSSQIASNIADAEKAAEELFPGAEVSAIGAVAEFAEMNGKIVRGELKSFAGSFIMIAAMLILVFMSIRTGLIGMIPNITPVIILAGIMGYFRFQLDMMTMTIMPMILGIAVDDTIHFINHVKYYYEVHGNYKDAILRTYLEIGKTMCMTTVIICAMFLIYAFSPMNTMHRIGMLSIIGLTTALAADYLMTPVLIYVTKPFGKEFDGIERKR
ncbi:RND family transporter [Treponema sp. Marseille-Q4130]|uniref:efflux RND transporter permease subunit n=1 Tax=Treponema sp. Marseille-Q4130 TaxID=2766702 RepID=UPI0016521A9F|nr:MMPL family transporter [Treponema sp. Marseille-Q4130]MBC6719808.1 MMPL family transporter [Treponema sp. Marseille-Q4130]